MAPSSPTTPTSPRGTLHLAYTYEDARDDDTDSPLLRRPKNKLDARRSSAASASVSVPAPKSSRPTRPTTSAARTLPGYAIVNLRATYTISADWSLTGRVENLFDRDYELVHGYNTPGLFGLPRNRLAAGGALNGVAFRHTRPLRRTGAARSVARAFCRCRGRHENRM